MKASETLVGTFDTPDNLPAEPKESLELDKRLQRIEELRAATDLKISSTQIPLRIVLSAITTSETYRLNHLHRSSNTGWIGAPLG